MIKNIFFICRTLQSCQGKQLFFLLLLFLFTITACVDFTTYSDSNEILAVKTGILSSEEVVIDNQKVISGTEGRIILRVRGQLEENMPLTVDADFELSPEAKILYGEKYKQFIFHSLRDSISFQVIAQSGLPKKWTLSLEDVRNNDGNIIKFSVDSYKAGIEKEDLVDKEGRIYKLKDTSLVEIFVNTSNDSVFPLEIKPAIQVAESGHLLDYNSPKLLKFSSLKDVCLLKVEAENRSIKDWKVALRTPDSDDVNLKGGSFMVISDCAEITDTAFIIDTLNADAIVKVKQVKDWKNFNILLQYGVRLPLGAKMVLLEEETEDFNDKKAIFSKIEDIRKFKVVSQSGKEKIWKMKLDYLYNRTAGVENFSIASYRPEETVNVTISPNCIDTLQKTIRLNVNTGVKYITEDTPLYVQPLLKLSDKATIEGMEPEQGGVYRLPEVSFTGISDEYRFTILSESQERFEWTLKLIDKQKEKDGEADLKNMMLHPEYLPEGIIFTDDIYTAIQEKCEVVLKLEAVKFPFMLVPEAYTINVSEKAKLMEKGKILAFESVNDKKTFKIEAENGEEKVWTLRLDYSQKGGAEVTEWRVSQVFPEQVVFDKTGKIDETNATITLGVTDAGTYFPLRFNVVPLLSANARMEPEIENLVFTREDEVIRFHVIAENGQTKEWQVVLKNQNVKSDLAELGEFHAESLNPEIQLGTVSLQGNKANVTVLSGKNRFPLSLDIDKSVLSEGAKADKVILTFDNIGRTEMFTVTSQSGNVKKNYTVSLINQIPLSDSAEIVNFRLERYTPLEYKLSGNVEITGQKAEVEVYGEIGRPLVLWPVVTLSGGARLASALPATGLEFSSIDQTAEVTVISESGQEKKWQIGLKQLPLPKNNEAVVEQIFTDNSENIVIEPVIKENNEVMLYLENAKPKYPFTVETTLTVSPNATVKVIDRQADVWKMMLRTRAASQPQVVQVVPLTFYSADDRITIEVTSEDEGTNNRYYFSLGSEKVKNNEANVLEYKIESYLPMNMPEAPIVFEPDTLNGIITVNAPGEEVFPFTIYTKMRLSYGAELNGLDGTTMRFERGFQGKEFEVISESGRVKKWQLIVKVAEKSKENNVTVFEIADYTPLTAGLGKPEIRNAERTVVIPVTDWKKGERLTINMGRIEVSPKASTDCRNTIFFQEATDEYRFNVTAQNGDVAEWKVVLGYTFSQQADITFFMVTAGEPASVVYQSNGVIDRETKTVYVDVVENLTFPFTMTVDMAFSEKTEVDLSGVSNNRIRFDKYQDSTVIRVTAEDEVTRNNWKVKLRYHFSEEAEITKFDLLASMPSSILLKEPAVEIVPAEHTIWIDIMEWGGQTNLQITPDVAVSDKAVHNLNGDLLFVKKVSETKTVQVTAESGKVTSWHVKLRYQESSDAEIMEVNYTAWEPSSVDFLGANIDSKNATVTFEFQSWQGSKSFTMKGISCKLSPKATANIPVEMTFTKLIQESVDYVVRAQDGTEKKWTFKVVYHESNAAEVTRFKVTGNNKPGVITMNPTGSIENGIIGIELNSGVRDAFEMGFQINVEVEVSAKASSDLPSTITFSKPSDQRRFTVTAESGLTKEWTVKFVNKASQEADLLAFRGVSIASASTSNTGDLKFTDLKLAGNTISMVITDVITLNKYEIGGPTLNLDLDVQLSNRAKVKEGTRISVNLGNLGSKTLTVLADDGVHQQTYQVEFAYRPQLENSNLDNWKDGKTLAGSIWSSANNTFVSGTARTSGKSGYGAVMSTSEAVGMKAAGTVFLGTFKFTSLTDALNDPEKMTFFGIPFPARPRQVKVDIQYRPGNGSLNDGSGDKGQVWVALEYWPDPNNAKNPNNKRYAYGEIMLSQTVGSWTTYTIEINVTDASVVPTHLLFVASSSYDGNHFNAVVGSEMKLDNVELVY